MLTTGNWLTIIGIVIATLIGIFQLIKSNKTKNNKTVITQKSGNFSNGNQKINITNNKTDKNG